MITTKMTEAELADLRDWAWAKPTLGLKGMAEDLKGVHEASKAKVVDWLIANDPERLAESRRIETETLASAPTSKRLRPRIW